MTRKLKLYHITWTETSIPKTSVFHTIGNTHWICEPFNSMLSNYYYCTNRTQSVLVLWEISPCHCVVSVYNGNQFNAFINIYDYNSRDIIYFMVTYSFSIQFTLFYMYMYYSYWWSELKIKIKVWETATISENFFESYNELTTILTKQLVINKH